jgi:spore maturation protein CgeB
VKLVIFGLSISSSWGNGHATLWRGLCKALTRAGHQVVFFERDVPYYRAHRDLAVLPDGELQLYTDWQDVHLLAERHLADADVAVTTSYCPDALAATALMLESGAPLRVFYDLDAPVTLERARRAEGVAYIGPRGLADYDLVLSYTGGRTLEELQTVFHAPRVAPLYGFVDPEAHYPVPAQPEWRCDLSYLGTYAEDRQEAVEKLFIEPARWLPDRRFLLGGAQYPQDFPWTDNVFFLHHVEPGRHPAFFCSSRLTLNVTRRAMREYGYCPSGRLFEAAACSTAVVSDSWDGLDHFFTPGDDVLVASSPEEAHAAVQLSDAELQRIGRRARERALAQHTAAHRAAEFERLLDEVYSSGGDTTPFAGPNRHQVKTSAVGGG